MPFMVAVPMIMAAVAATVSAIGSIRQGSATQNADNYNAEIAGQRATQATQASDAQSQIVGQQTQDKIATAGAAYGAAGVDMAGTPLSVMSSLATKGELNRQLTLYQGTVAATADRNQAALDKAQGSAAYSAGLLAAGTSLLTGSAQTATQYNQLTAGGASSGYTPLAAGENPFAGTGGSLGAGGMT